MPLPLINQALFHASQLPNTPANPQCPATHPLSSIFTGTVADLQGPSPHADASIIAGVAGHFEAPADVRAWLERLAPADESVSS